MDSCEYGIKKAFKDVENGKYKLLSYGLPLYKNREFQTYYESFILKKYSIQIGNGGCIINQQTECYSKKMRELIYEKFGKDIFEKARLAAKAEYEINIQEKIDNGFIFTIVDSIPQFVGGNDSLLSFFLANLNYTDKLSR